MHFDTNKAVSLVLKAMKQRHVVMGVDEHFPHTATIKFSAGNISFQACPKRNSFRRDGLPVKFKR